MMIIEKASPSFSVDLGILFVYLSWNFLCLVLVRSLVECRITTPQQLNKIQKKHKNKKNQTRFELNEREKVAKAETETEREEKEREQSKAVNRENTIAYIYIFSK